MSRVATVTVPALPCENMEATLAFWESVGFTVTYRQKAPSAYGVVHYDDCDLHFYGMKNLPPENNYATCLVLVPEVEQLHAQYVDRLRAALGKVPVKGFPRISRMRPGQTRFTLTDVAGNSVIYITRGAEDEAAAQEYKKADLTPLQRSISMATRLRDFHCDDAKAAIVLDVAMAKETDHASLDYGRALAARIELAIAMEEPARLNELRAAFAALALTPADRAQILSEMPAAAKSAT